MYRLNHQLIKGIIAVIPLFFGCSKQEETPSFVPEIVDTLKIPDPIKKEIPNAFAGLDTTTYNDRPLLSGTFSGKLHYNSFNGQHIEIKGIQITFKDDLYECNFYGKGSYEVRSNRVIVFSDRGYYTADFDYGLILSRSYRYFAKGDSLILNKDLSYRDSISSKTQYYQYRLKRDN